MVSAAGARTINVPDTVGYVLPEALSALVEDLYRRVPELHDAVLSFQPGDTKVFENRGGAFVVKQGGLPGLALALTAVDLFMRPAVIEDAKREHHERTGPDFEYEPLLGDRAPPLDYRKPTKR